MEFEVKDPSRPYAKIKVSYDKFSGTVQNLLTVLREQGEFMVRGAWSEKGNLHVSLALGQGCYLTLCIPDTNIEIIPTNTEEGNMAYTKARLLKDVAIQGVTFKAGTIHRVVGTAGGSAYIIEFVDKGLIGGFNRLTMVESDLDLMGGSSDGE